MSERLLLLSDRTQLPPGRTLLETLDACVAAGASTIVLRELDLPTPARASLAERVAARGVRVIAAHFCLPGTIGVHLPAADSNHRGAGAHGSSPGACAQAMTPRYVGASCHSATEVHAVARQGVDYATLSPFASTVSKPGYGPPLPRSEYHAAASAGIPVYALGGITPANAADALAAGAGGIAVMGEVMRADDPGAVVRRLLEAVR